MGHFLAERYLSWQQSTRLPQDIERMDAVGTTDVRLLSTLYIPDDEVCFHLFESESAELVEEAGRTAGLDLQRVLSVVAFSKGDER